METLIEWADYTFNPWWGCEKVSLGCKNCYAERHAGRFGDYWGGSPRRLMSASTWKLPRKWAREAARDGQRRRVFAGSMCDIFEARAELAGEREQLWALIEATPELDWLLLTKRPENIDAMVPLRWHDGGSSPPWWEAGEVGQIAAYGWPSNVWLGVSVENQDEAWRVDQLRRFRAAKLFVSYEPALGPVDWEAVLAPWRCAMCGRFGGRHERGESLVRPMRCPTGNLCSESPIKPVIDWLVVGAESGDGARPMDLDWVRRARDAAATNGVAFFFKQDAENGRKRSLPLLDGRQHMEFPQ